MTSATSATCRYWRGVSVRRRAVMRRIARGSRRPARYRAQRRRRPGRPGRAPPARPLRSRRVGRARSQRGRGGQGVPPAARAGAHAQGACAAPVPAHAASTSCTRSRTSPSTSQQGEFFGIVGRNGSGKSTLLKCLAGHLHAPTRGAIYVRGRMSTFIELGVGFNPDLAGARQRDHQRRSCSASSPTRGAARASTASSTSPSSRSSWTSSSRTTRRACRSGSRSR